MSGCSGRRTRPNCHSTPLAFGLRLRPIGPARRCRPRLRAGWTTWTAAGREKRTERPVSALRMPRWSCALGSALGRWPASAAPASCSCNSGCWRRCCCPHSDAAAARANSAAPWMPAEESNELLPPLPLLLPVRRSPSFHGSIKFRRWGTERRKTTAVSPIVCRKGHWRPQSFSASCSALAD